MNLLPAAWSQEQRSLSERLLYLGYANIEQSISAFEEIIRAPKHPDDWNRCCAAASSAEHGIELWLKGAIWQARGKPGNTHALDRLSTDFKTLYSDPEFTFTSRFSDLVAKDDTEPFCQFFDYPTDREGCLLHINKYFDPAVWKPETEAVLADLRRMEPLIYRRYPFVAITNALWDAIDATTGVRTYLLGACSIRVSAMEVIPPPRTSIIALHERGTLALTTWSATQAGLDAKAWVEIA